MNSLNNMLKFLVFREEGIGNCLLTTPMLKALKKKFPDCTIDVMVSDRGYAVLEGNPYIDNLILYTSPITSTYDYGIDAQFTSAVYRTMVKDKCNKLLTIDKDFKNKHEAEHNLEIIKREFNAWDGGFVPMSISIPQSDIDYAIAILKGSSNPVVIHTGCLINLNDAKDVWRNRRWYISYWIELIEKLQKQYKADIFLAGNIHELKDSQEIIANTKNVVNLINRTSIKQIAAILQLSKLLVCIDCGIMHIGAAVGTNIASLWGATSEIKSHPWTLPEKYIIIRDTDLNCQRCYTEHQQAFLSCDDRKCMRNITPDLVISKIKERGWLC